MSTILKALAKLEREKEAIRATGPIPVISAPGPAGGRPAVWYLKPWVWLSLVGFIIVLLGGTAWHFYRQSREYTPRLAERSTAMEHPPARSPANAKPRAAASPIPDASGTRSRQPNPMQDLRQHPTLPQTTGGNGRPQLPGKQFASRTLEPPPVQEKPAVPHPMHDASRALLSGGANQQGTTGKSPVPMEKIKKAESPPANSPAEPHTAPQKKAPTDAYANTPLLTDGRLRVHAIAWAPQASERMAVINSHVLHEGDDVDDFTVMVIRPDDVVVREKGKGVWRVEFGRP